MDHILLTCSHVGCFQFEAMTNSAMDIHVHVYVESVCISLGQISKNRTAGLYDKCTLHALGN